ncbi:hypothetical protein [Anaeromyxobacter paludicola]|uniref:EamA domain-containing protein n=1 Tax=Anaeromyxobacter paludicola TaxID=2918171 RepID=A0ABN6NBQ7_9BACT|nr:hypothetical protein [Anaeromyxobacter paludicola]BDG09790.1 hypothetical protein AMPC_29030 [Anaeromyxobacter paludicola]
MKSPLLFLLVAALGSVTYHLGQRTNAARANPMVLLMAVYAVAFLLCALAAPLFSAGGPTYAWSRDLVRWPVLLLALGAVLIEIGFLLAYRSGAMMQWSAVAVNGVAALLLVPLACLVFRESFSPARAAGIALTLAGLGLLTRG